MLTATLLVMLLALVVRLIYLLELRQSPFFAVPVIDAQTYDQLARGLAAGNWLGAPRPFWQPPLYPYLLGLLYMGGAGPTLVRVAQMLLGTATVGLTCLLAGSMGGRRVGLLAGIGAALYGPFLFFEGRLLPPALILGCNLLGLYLFMIARRPRTYLAAGLAFGLAAIARPDAFAVALALAAGLFCRRSPRPWRPALLFLLAVVLPIIPVTARNLMVGRDLVWVSANGGINFYLGNNPQADATLALRPGLEWEHLVETPHRDAGLTQASARSRYFYRQAGNFFRQQPVAAASNLLRKTGHLVSSVEIRRNEDLYELRRESKLLSLLLWRVGSAGFPLGLIAPLAWLGAGLAWSRRRHLWPVYVYVATYALVAIAYFVTARYRLPIVPVALCFAALGGQALWAARVDRRRLLRLLTVTALIAIPINLLPAPGQIDTDSEYWQLLAIAQHDQGNHTAAVEAQTRAVVGRPDAPELHYDLGVYRVGDGDTLGAIQAYRRALELEPAYAEAMVNLGMLLAHRDSVQTAIRLLVTAAAIAPDLVPAQVSIAGAFLHSGYPDSALAHYDLALRLDPTCDTAWLGRGATLLAAGRATEAIAAYRQALELAGETAPILRGLGKAQKNAGRYPEALVTLRRAARLESDPRLHVTLGQVYRNLGRLDDAQAEYLTALQLAPGLVQAHINLGDVYARKGLYDLAQGALITALRIDPTNVTALYNQAAVEVNLGDEARAVVALERLLRLDPEHAAAKHALARLRGEAEH